MLRFARLTLFTLFLAVALLLPAGAADSRKRDPDLWATVNRCDGVKSPNRMGMRASVPGNGTRERMYVRFRAQYFDDAAETWRVVRGTGTSRWFLLGDARVRARQGGYTFGFDPPAAGDAFVLRGVADFQYRARRKRKGHRAAWKVVKRARAHTRRGISKVRGGEPRYRSDSICVIKAP